MGKELRDFGIVFRSVACNNKLSYGARTLYSILCTYRDKSTNTCFPGTNLLKDALGTTNRTRINDWLQELEDVKAIRRDTVFTTDKHIRRRTIVITDDNYEE